MSPQVSQYSSPLFITLHEFNFTNHALGKHKFQMTYLQYDYLFIFLLLFSLQDPHHHVIFYK